MSINASGPESVTGVSPQSDPGKSSIRPARFNRTLILGTVAFLMGSAVMFFYRPFNQMEGGDDAIWDYITQLILRGQVPYRDVIENKAPGGAYLSALVMTAGRAIGAQDIISVRWFYVLLVGLLCTLVFLVAQVYLRNYLASMIAASIPLMSEDLAVMMISGTRPKLPMILFGLMTVLLIVKDRPFWAGFCSMLSCICWQPGLLFTGTALLIFTRYLRSWRDRRGLKLLLGAAIPLAVLLLYFFAVGALGDLWSATITYNYSVYMPEGYVGPGVALTHLWRLLREAMGTNIIWVKLSIIGLLIFGAKRLSILFKKNSGLPESMLQKDAVLIPALVYLVFCVVNYQGKDGLIPLLPFIGLFAGVFCAEAQRLIASPRSIKQSFYLRNLVEWLPLLPLVLIAITVLDRSLSYRMEPGKSLQDQQSAFKVISDLLGPDDKLYVHGTLEILVLLNRPNLNRYILLARGTDDYIAAKIPGGFQTIIDEMEAAAPKIVSITRTQNVAHRAELMKWVEENYDKLPVDFAHNSVYVRREVR